MDDQFLQQVSSVAQAVIALAALIASIAIPYVVHQAQRRRESLEFIHAVRSMWISIDAIVLQRDELLQIAESIPNPTTELTGVARQQERWISLMFLNAFYLDYLGATKGFHSEEALQVLRQPLKNYVANDRFYALTQDPGAYDPGFREFCRGAKSSAVKTGA